MITRAARLSSNRLMIDAAETLAELRASDGFTNLEARRGMDYHRRRPQSVERTSPRREAVVQSMITVAGAGKAVRGAHPDVIIGDDVLEEATTSSAHMRRKTERWWFGTVRTLPTRARVTLPPTLGRLAGTSFHADDLLMSMRKNPIWAFYRYSAEFDPAQLSRPGDSLAVEIQ